MASAAEQLASKGKAAGQSAGTGRALDAAAEPDGDGDDVD